MHHFLSLAGLNRKNAVRGRFQAEKSECEALAKQAGILEISAFTVYYTITPMRMADVFRLEMSIVANVVQECVLTLKPISVTLKETITCLCGMAGAVEKCSRHHANGGAADQEIQEEPALCDAEGQLDIAALAAEYLILALDPYPRYQDVALGDVLAEAGMCQQDNRVDSEIEDKPKKTKPFAVLASLAQK